MRRPDRHALYEVAVQGPDWDLDFLERVFRRRNQRAPRTFREDFCSTAALATAWAMRHPENHSWAVDLDPEPLAWARKFRLPYVRDAALQNLRGSSRRSSPIAEATRAVSAWRASVRRLSSDDTATTVHAIAGASSASLQPTRSAIVGIVVPETKPPIVTPTCLTLISRLRCRVVWAPRTITLVGGVIRP